MGRENVKHLLIAPLDWGSGHTTRCVPLIRSLERMGHKVTIAGNESQLSFLSGEFPHLRQWHLEGYGVRYASSGKLFIPALAAQLPRIAGVIRREHRWLREKMEKEPLDGIISDNRYGLFHPRIPSVIITHQLQLHSGLGSFADRLLSGPVNRMLRRFSEVWIPDIAGSGNISGKLGHPHILPAKSRYIGLLSHISAGAGDHPDVQPGRLLVMLSGPEPQRSILASAILAQAGDYPGEILFVSGSMQDPPPGIPDHVTYFRRLSSRELQPLIASAEMILCRSGYSTVMDLVAEGRKAILIPTPGQTEQEYLGRKLHREGIFYSTSQRHFRLGDTIRRAAGFPFSPPQIPAGSFTLHVNALQEWTARLGNR